MNDRIITIYCLCGDHIKSLKAIKDKWPDEKMSDSEVMAVLIVASRFFYGNVERARQMLK